MIVVDVHLEIAGGLTVEESHKIAVQARQYVMQWHRVLNLMTYVDPWRPSSAPTKGEYRIRLSVARFDGREET